MVKNPFGLHSITPYLVVENLDPLITFIEKVFNGKLRGEATYRSDRSVQHAEITIGDSIIMLAETSPLVPEISAMNSGMYVYVKDCDQSYKKSLQSGAVSIAEPKDYPHGDRFAGVKDFAGNIWWIVTHKGKYDIRMQNN